MTPTTSAMPSRFSASRIPSQGRLRRLVEWGVFSAVPVWLLVQFTPQLMAFWRWLITRWAEALGLSPSAMLSVSNNALHWPLIQDGSLVPSTTRMLITAMAAGIIWLLSALLHDRFHPLKIALRWLCLIQWSACLFFALVPSSYPYTIGKHLNALMAIGYGFMLAIGPMLALGWGILNVPLASKIVAPFVFIAYFALMLPHKALLHMWVLAHFSILFMPVLFLCFGALLDLWIFIALYALLASMTPTNIPASSLNRGWK